MMAVTGCGKKCPILCVRLDFVFFFQAEDGIRDYKVTGVQTCALPIYYIETPEDVAARVRRCLQFAPAERLSFAPDCGLSQTARWAARAKLRNLVAEIGRASCRERV